MLALRKFPWLQILNSVKNEPVALSVIGHLVVLMFLSINFSYHKKPKLMVIGTVKASVKPGSKVQNKAGQQKKQITFIRASQIKDGIFEDSVKILNKNFNAIMERVQKKKRKSEELQFEQILKDVKRSKKKLDEKNQAKKTSGKDKVKEDFKNVPPISSQEEMEIKNQIYPKWSIPAGIKNVENYFVDVYVALAEDGAVTTAKVISALNSTEAKIIAESAVRAVLLASPLKFKNTKKAGIRNFILRFDLKEALL